jgi:hypothetical protein
MSYVQVIRRIETQDQTPSMQIVSSQKVRRARLVKNHRPRFTGKRRLDENGKADSGQVM